jgi:hypothetical protein
MNAVDPNALAPRTPRNRVAVIPGSNHNDGSRSVQRSHFQPMPKRILGAPLFLDTTRGFYLLSGSSRPSPQ